MKIVISPAKKMRLDPDALPWRSLPVFLDKTEQLCRTLQGMSYEELKKLWKCNDAIAALNTKRLADMDLYARLTPALLAYEGIQYQYMAPNVFTDLEYRYVQEHLRILSGFYGLLKPFDGVAPYRLEMQAKLVTPQGKDLYSFWGSSIAEQLFQETDCILNLASKEYSLCISRYLPKHIRLVTCIFGQEKDGRIVEKGTMCKMARGEMVRYMAERQIADLKELRAFDRLGYIFDPACSQEDTYVFLRKEHC